MNRADLVLISSLLASVITFGIGASELRDRRGQLTNNPLAWFLPLVMLCVGMRGIAATLTFARNWAWAKAVSQETLWEIVVPNMALVAVFLTYLAARALYLHRTEMALGAHDFPDKVTATRKAIELHDGVLQDLVKARWSLGIGREKEAMEHIDAAAIGTQVLIGQKLRESGVPRSAVLRRDQLSEP